MSASSNQLTRPRSSPQPAKRRSWLWWGRSAQKKKETLLVLAATAVLSVMSLELLNFVNQAGMITALMTIACGCGLLWMLIEALRS